VAAALALAEARCGELDRRADESRIAWPASWDDALGGDKLAEIERLIAVEAPAAQTS
jgi:hypothetical protein